MDSGQWTAPWSGGVEVQEAGQILEEYLLQGSFANMHSNSLITVVHNQVIVIYVHNLVLINMQFSDSC
jgi:hypothetical protein